MSSRSSWRCVLLVVCVIALLSAAAWSTTNRSSATATGALTSSSSSSSSVSSTRLVASSPAQPSTLLPPVLVPVPVVEQSAAPAATTSAPVAGGDPPVAPPRTIEVSVEDLDSPPPGRSTSSSNNNERSTSIVGCRAFKKIFSNDSNVRELLMCNSRRLRKKIKCPMFDYTGFETTDFSPRTQVDSRSKNLFEDDYFQGAPIVRSSEYSADAVADESRRAQNVRSLCDGWPDATSPLNLSHFAVTPGCRYLGVSSTVGTLYWNVFSLDKVTRLMRSPSSGKQMEIKKCVQRQRQRQRSVAKILSKEKNRCLLNKYAELRTEFEWYSSQQQQQKQQDRQFTPVPTATASSASASGKRGRKSSPAPPPTPRPSLRLSQRKRLLVVVQLQRNPLSLRKRERVRQGEDEATWMRRPPHDFASLFKSFLSVADRRRDQLVLLTDYDVPEWIAMFDKLVAARQTYDSETTAAPATAPRGPLRLVDVSTWRKEGRMRFVPDLDEPPLSARVFYIQHFIDRLQTQDGEHDGTVGALIFADARDVVFQTNPFDALASVPQFRGVAVAAEVYSHCCTIGRTNARKRGRGVIPAWETVLLGKTAALHALCPLDLGPHEQPFPILNSGVIGLSNLSVAHDFALLHASTLSCQDNLKKKLFPAGLDQPALNVAVAFGISTANFPHEIFVLNAMNNPLVSHMHVAQSDASSLLLQNRTSSVESRSGEEHVYLNCAGRPWSILHQMDRKLLRLKAWEESRWGRQ